MEAGDLHGQCYHWMDELEEQLPALIDQSSSGGAEMTQHRYTPHSLAILEVEPGDELTPHYLKVRYQVEFQVCAGDTFPPLQYLWGLKRIPVNTEGELVLDEVDFRADLKPGPGLEGAGEFPGEDA